ncbi:MAG TPA: alpha/beta fold hydrolase [Roseiflexaceae bacterium]|nr:alpha/beta fold hydrolase [Roseiflexaceae bacterium]
MRQSRIRAPARLLAAMLSLVAIGLGLWRLEAPRLALGAVEALRVDEIPATLYAPARPNGPAVVIAHGFAGSQQLMEPFALTLARAGYTAITFDFPGHGQNSTPLAEGAGRTADLDRALDRVVALARERSDGRVALLGHSMGSHAVVRYAQAHPEIEATVAVSLVYGGVTASSPRNLLVLTGALEGGLRPLAQAVVDAAAGGAGREGVTYGSFADGSARRVVFPALVEHIGVLYSPASMAETLGWLDAVFGGPARTEPFLDDRPAWLALVYLGAIALFFALLASPKQQPAIEARTPSATSTQNSKLKTQNSLAWWLVAVLPALAAPLLLLLLPAARLLPILVGGPLALLFALYGLLTAAGLLWLRRGDGRRVAIPSPGWLLGGVAVALLVVGYVFLTFGLPAQRYVLNYFPPPARLPVFAAVALAMLPYFLADEWLTRGGGAPRGAYAITKACFLASLVLAIVLDRGLSFLTLIAPLFLLYFLVYGLFSGLVFRRTGTPLAGALANTLIFAWSVAAVFPLVR